MKLTSSFSSSSKEGDCGGENNDDDGDEAQKNVDKIFLGIYHEALQKGYDGVIENRGRFERRLRPRKHQEAPKTKKKFQVEQQRGYDKNKHITQSYIPKMLDCTTTGPGETCCGPAILVSQTRIESENGDGLPLLEILSELEKCGVEPQVIDEALDKRTKELNEKREGATQNPRF